MELQNYLNDTYPKNSPIWNWIRISFLNDYHRDFKDCTIAEINKINPNRGSEYFRISLCGSAMYSTFEWFKYLDKKLHSLRKTGDDSKIVIIHFDVEDIKKSSDKVADLTYGQGFCEGIRNLVKADFCS